MQLHPRTSTPKASTVLRDFLAQAKCICCTVRVVSLTGSRAVVEWGSVPYFTARGRRAEFVYYTAERAADLRPEVLRTYAGREEKPAEWVRDRLRDSWLVERLVYWAEFLEEWKFYREWYVYRADLFERLPDVFSPGCGGASRRIGLTACGDGLRLCLEGSEAIGTVWGKEEEETRPGMRGAAEGDVCVNGIGEHLV